MYMGGVPYFEANFCILYLKSMVTMFVKGVDLHIDFIQSKIETIKMESFSDLMKTVLI